MKITINQAASFTGKPVRRINKGDDLAIKLGKVAHKRQSYVGKSSKKALPAANSLTITLNALAYGTYSTLKNRKNADGNFYTITFPDDFVHTKLSGQTISVADQEGSVTIPKDPFVNHRSYTAPYPINADLNVTIEIPHGMSVGTNSHARHVDPAQVLHGFVNPQYDEFNPFAANDSIHLGPDNSTVLNGLISVYPASSDPCFLFDFDTTKVTDLTLSSCNITIRNSGNTIGGGGYGGKGVYTAQSGKFATNRSLGGGAGGMGLHQAYSAVSAVDTPHLFNQYDWNRLGTSTGRAQGGPPDETEGGTAGVGGQAASFGDHRNYSVTLNNSGASANGTAGDIDGPGAAGATGTHNNFQTIPIRTSQTAAAGAYGGWGGNVVYFKSNTHLRSTGETYSGVTFNFINEANGFMFAGAGGGGGGRIITHGGGDGGSWYGAGGSANGFGDGADYASVRNNAYMNRGLRGLMFFRNTSNVEVTRTFTNYNVSGLGFRGRDVWP